jgi:hypothetical protein
VSAQQGPANASLAAASPVPVVKPAIVGSPAPSTSTPTKTPTPIAQPSSVPGGPASGTLTPTPTPPSGCGPNPSQTNGSCTPPREKLRCDFDGDGKGDLAVGVPGEDNGRGAVNIGYSKGGLADAPAIMRPRLPDHEETLADAYFGAALACGDFNGDGVGDLAVGAPHTPVGGSVWVLWGKAGSGLDETRYLEFHQATGGIAGSPMGYFGHALAAGDFGRDGVDDLAVGDPGEPLPETRNDSGVVVVIPGRSGGLWIDGQYQLRGGPVMEKETVGYFGWSLAAGQLVPGGGDDLAVGAPLSGWPDDYQHAGRVYIFREHGGLVPLHHVDEAAIGAAAPASGVKAESSSWFGWSVAIGDFNGDEKADLAVGIPAKSVPLAGRAGQVVVIAGNGVGVDPANHKYLTQASGGGDPEDGDMYGWSLAAGNWSVDQFDDLAVGAPYENTGPSHAIVSRAGAVTLHFGAAGLTFGGKTMRQGDGSTPGTANAHDWFGLSLTSVRLGQVDLDFLVIGIPGEPRVADIPGCNKSGAVQLGMSWSGVGPIVDPTLLMDQDTKAPYNVADDRECSSAPTPWIMNFGDPASPSKGGEFFGWALGS